MPRKLKSITVSSKRGPDMEVCPAGTMRELADTRRALMMCGKLLRDLLQMFPYRPDEPEAVKRARWEAK